MKTINFDEYEVGLLDRYLEDYKKYLINKPIKDGFDDRAYDIEMIQKLLGRVRKNNYRPYYEVQRGMFKEKILNETEEQVKTREYRFNLKEKKGEDIWK